jgi:hypothetical protein
MATFLMGISISNSFAVSEGKVPTCVKSTFYAQFPFAESIHWTKGKSDVYNVKFIMDENIATAAFSDKGVMLESQIAYFNDDVPPYVLQEIKKNTNVHVMKFVKTIDINRDEFFKLTLRKGTEGFEVLFDKDWKVLEVYEMKPSKNL